jgi:hypothetical protein
MIKELPAGEGWFRSSEVRPAMEAHISDARH